MGYQLTKWAASHEKGFNGLSRCHTNRRMGGPTWSKFKKKKLKKTKKTKKTVSYQKKDGRGQYQKKDGSGHATKATFSRDAAAKQWDII